VPSLAKLDAGDNLPFTTDFRRVYATMAETWLGANSSTVLNEKFKTFGMFA
jgi:uncharacterized protein (DUF1501 family)